MPSTALKRLRVGAHFVRRSSPRAVNRHRVLTNWPTQFRHPNGCSHGTALAYGGASPHVNDSHVGILS